MNTATAAAHFFGGQFEETERWTRRTLERWPAHPVNLRYRAAALVQLGYVEEARRTVSELLKVQPNSCVRARGKLPTATQPSSTCTLLAAILSADVVGISSMMEKNDEGDALIS